MDIVELGMDVDSRPLKKTNTEMDRFAKEGKRVDGAARGVEKSTGLMAAGMKRAAIAITATIGAMAAVSGGIRTLANFEKQMSTVGAVSRATAAEMQAMRDVAADLGSTTEFTAQQAGEGLEFLARAGFSASESVSAIPAVLDLATASAMGLGSAADISSNIMSAFGIEAGEAASVADVLAAASSRANTDVQQLGDAMSFVGPVAASLEISMSDAAAAIGVLSDAGIQGSSAGTGLRRVLSSLANPTKQAAGVLSDLGLEMDALNPQTNSIVEVVQELADAGLTAADALTIFGDRGGPAILALTSQTGRLEELTGALTGVEGEAARMADTMRDNLGGDIDSLFSSIQGLVIALGDAGLTAVIRGVIQALTGLVRGISGVVDAIGAGIDAIGDFANSILGIKTAEEIREAAIDNVTIAMGDQMRATAALNRMINDGLPSNIAMIEAKIEEAKARRANVQELVAERQEIELTKDGYFDLIERIGDTREALAAMRAPGDDLEQMPANMRASFEETEQALVAMLERQKEMLADVREGNFLRDEERAHLEEIEDNLDALRAVMADLTGEAADNVDLTERLSLLSGQINFDDATDSARALARMLGVGLENAAGMNRALNRDAGIPGSGGQQGLSFPGGAPNASLPGGFTASGGELVFGNLNGPNPSDFLTAPGSSGQSASDLNREADAIERVVGGLREQVALVGLSEEARRTQQALQRAGVDLYSEEGQQIAGLVEEYTALENAQRANDRISRTLKGSILDFAENGADAIDGVTAALKRMALEAALFGEGPLGGLFGGADGGGLLGNLVSSITGGLGATTQASTNLPGVFDSSGAIALPSFDGGGFTGTGSRSGGLDGKGGFIGLLHPNERVIDDARGGGTRPVVNNITISAPPGSDVQEQRSQNSTGGEDLTLLIDKAVSGLARDPSSNTSKTLRQNFGLRPATRGR